MTSESFYSVFTYGAWNGAPFLLEVITMRAKVTVKGSEITVTVEGGKGTKCIDFTKFLLDSKNVKVSNQELTEGYTDGPKLIAEQRLP